MTALHLASVRGKTETAMALVIAATRSFLADADVLCPSKDGYDFGLHRGTAASATFL